MGTIYKTEKNLTARQHNNHHYAHSSDLTKSDQHLGSHTALPEATTNQVPKRGKPQAKTSTRKNSARSKENNIYDIVISPLSQSSMPRRSRPHKSPALSSSQNNSYSDLPRQMEAAKKIYMAPGSVACVEESHTGVCKKSAKLLVGRKMNRMASAAGVSSAGSGSGRQKSKR